MNAIISFPKRKKRGRKITRGTAAPIVRLCVSEEMEKQWAWLDQNGHRWEDEEPEGEPRGFLEGDHWKTYVDFCKGIGVGLDKKPLTPELMRSDIARWRARIKKRVAAKDWLERLGINWDECSTPEAAVLFLFDRFGGP